MRNFLNYFSFNLLVIVFDLFDLYNSNRNRGMDLLRIMDDIKEEVNGKNNSTVMISSRNPYLEEKNSGNFAELMYYFMISNHCEGGIGLGVDGKSFYYICFDGECFNQANKKCSRCLVSRYCSTKCQRSDWFKTHGNFCRALTSYTGSENWRPTHVVKSDLDIMDASGEFSFDHWSFEGSYNLVYLGFDARH